MREIESAASRDWLADRAGEDDVAASEVPEGKTEIQLDDLAGGAGGFSAVTFGESALTANDDDWLKELQFDESGRKVPVDGVEVAVSALAKQGRGWAEYAADDLLGASTEPDTNNLACALAYAKPENVTGAHAILKTIPKPGPIVRDNLQILGRHVLELPS